jgi:hypothetical protein
VGESNYRIVIAFNAAVLSWSIDDHPPPELSRHYIREGSFYNSTDYRLALEIRLPSKNSLSEKLSINFIGVREDSMYPNKIKDAKLNSFDGELSFTMRILEYLDEFLLRTTSGSVDTLLMGCIGGVIEI